MSCIPSTAIGGMDQKESTKSQWSNRNLPRGNIANEYFSFPKEDLVLLMMKTLGSMGYRSALLLWKILRYLIFKIFLARLFRHCKPKPASRRKLPHVKHCTMI